MKLKLVIFLFLAMCCTSRKDSNNTDDGSYKVVKIESANGWNFIYSYRAGKNYKIISKKDSSITSNYVKIGERYHFELESLLSDRKIGDVTLLRANSLLVNCIYLDSITNACLEGDTITDLYVAKNLKGLSLTEEPR